MEVLGVAVLILGLVGLGILNRYLRERKLTRMHEMLHLERLRAMEKGIPLPDLGHDDIVRELRSLCTADQPGRAQHGAMVWLRVYSLSLGLIFLLGGVGALAGLLLVPEHEAGQFWPLGLIPVMIGVGLLLFYSLTRGYADRTS